MTYLCIIGACFIYVLLLVGCQTEEDETAFQDFVREVLAQDANDEPVEINRHSAYLLVSFTNRGFRKLSP